MSWCWAAASAASPPPAISPPPQGGDVEVRLINRSNFLTYTPFLADVAGGTIAVVHAVPPLRAMAPGRAHRGRRGRKHRRRRAARRGQAARRPRPRRARYDYLVIALGATTSFRHGAGAAEFGLPLMTVADAYLLRNRVLEMLELASV